MSNVAYDCSDVIYYQVHDIKIGISPLAFMQKMEIEAMMYDATRNGNRMAIMNAGKQAIKFGLKSIEGVLNFTDNKPMELKFEDNTKKCLTEDCIDKLLNLKQSQGLIAVCIKLINGVPETKDFTHPSGNEKPMEHISMVKKTELPLAPTPTESPK